MADCCQELRVELAALRAEVAKLGKVDEESIVTRAFNKSKDYLEPIISGVSGVAIAAGVKATSAYNLGELASMKAGSAFSKATAAGQVAATAQKTAVVAEGAAAAASGAAKSAGATARLAQVVATAAQGAAATAAALAATALGKALLALAQLLTIAGSIAGLFALYGQLKVVFPRLDAHDAQLDSQQSQISKNSSDIFGVQQKIKKVQAQVDDVQAVAERGLDEAQNANRKIDLLKPKVEDVTTRVDRVEPKVEDVTNKVKILTPKVEDVTTRVDRVEPKVEDVTNKVKVLTPKVDDVTTRVDRVEPKVEDVTNKVKVLTPKVDDAQKTADYAFSTAVTIKPIAVEALQETKEIRPISEEALAKAFVSLNEIKVVKPVAFNAFEATQLQARELKGTKLEVTKLGTVSRDHTKQIELNTNDIKNLKTTDQKIEQKLAAPPTTKQPDTSKQDQMNDKTLKDIQTQVGLVTIGLAGITAALKPIADNTTPAAIQNNTAAAVCRTAQPGGCMSNLANNAASNASNNVLNNLGNAANTAANAAQLALLNSIQTGVNTANTRLGPLLNGANGISGFLGRMSSSMGVDRALNLIAIASNLHNAMMLSANLKITLLEVLSSVGNATGLLQTSEGDNVDLNQVFNQGIEAFMTTLIGVDNYAGLKVNLRKYNSIYRAATNSLNAVSSMFNSLGEAVETAAEYTGKIGNALRAASVVRENAYNFMSEKISVKNSRFMTFENKIGGATQILETINEIAENVVEGQQQYTEAVKATADFQKQIADAAKNPGIDNKAIKEEAEKIKTNLVKDPTGEDETGLLSFLTD